MDFFPNVQEIVDAALRAIGAIDPEGGVTPTTTQRNNAMEALNFIITAWQAHGLQVWRNTSVDCALTASTSEYTIGSHGSASLSLSSGIPLSVNRAWLRDNTVTPAVDIPLQLISRENYQSISMKATTGTPNSLYFEREYTAGGSTALASVHLWPTPDSNAASTYALHVDVTRPVDDFTATTDEMDFPHEWFGALKWNLALALCPEYEVPTAKWDRINKMAEATLDLAMSWDTEKLSMTVSPAQQ